MKRRWNQVIVTPRRVFGRLPDAYCYIIVRGPTGRCVKQAYYRGATKIVWRIGSVLYGEKMIFHWRYAR